VSIIPAKKPTYSTLPQSSPSKQHPDPRQKPQQLPLNIHLSPAFSTVELFTLPNQSTKKPLPQLKIQNPPLRKNQRSTQHNCS
jgi:hypothetical protein